MINLPPVEQLGFVVKDLDKAMEYYGAVFGWGPFRIETYKIEGATFRGRPCNFYIKCAFTQNGSLEVELIQVLDGETPHSEFLKNHGDGLQHLRFRVDDVDAVTAKLAEKGVQTIFYKAFPVGTFAYVENPIGGVMFEFVDEKKRR